MNSGNGKNDKKREYEARKERKGTKSGNEKNTDKNEYEAGKDMKKTRIMKKYNGCEK